MNPKLEKKNEFMSGSFAGAVGAAVKYAFNEIMQAAGIAAYDNNATAVTVVMIEYRETITYAVFGFFTALTIGAFFGVIIAFTFSRILTENNYFIKSAGLGVWIWLFNFGLISKVFNYPEGIRHSLNDTVVMLISLIIYSVVTAYVLKWTGLFREDC